MESLSMLTPTAAFPKRFRGSVALHSYQALQLEGGGGAALESDGPASSSDGLHRKVRPRRKALLGTGSDELYGSRNSATSLRSNRTPLTSNGSRRKSEAREEDGAGESNPHAVERQLDLLQREVYCLQNDNVTLLRQLEDQHLALASTTFDLERYRIALQEHRLDPPPSLYDEVVAQARLPRAHTEAGPLPEALLQAARLSEEEKARFESVQSLVASVSDLQLRLRDARLAGMNTANERVAELESLVAAVETQLAEVRQSRDLLLRNHEEELRIADAKAEALRRQLEASQDEKERLIARVDSLKKEEAVRLEELKVEELTEKLTALSEVVETQREELARLRTENSSLHASNAVNTKELEYLAASLNRERQASDSLRHERNKLYDEINGARTDASQSATEALLLRSRLEVAERSSKAREEEAEEWRERVQEMQQKFVDQQSEWGSALQESQGLVGRLEAAQTANMERIAVLEERIETLRRESNERCVELEQRIAEKDAQNLSLREVIRDAEKTAEEALRAKSLAEEERRGMEESKELVVKQLEAVEAEAAILKQKHPHLDFGVLEEELRRFEEEREASARQTQKMAVEVEDLKGQLQEQSELAQNRGIMTESLAKALAIRDAEVAEAQSSQEALQTELSQERQKLQEANEAQEQLCADIAQLEKTIEELRRREAELQGSLAQATDADSSKVAQLEKEIEAEKAKLAEMKLTLEATTQGHRLEIQAHSRDIQDLQLLRSMMETRQKQHAEETASLQKQLKDKQNKIMELTSHVEDGKRVTEALKAQRQQLQVEITELRGVLSDKLDKLDLTGDELKQELVEKLRTEEALKKEVERLRVGLERATLDAKCAEQDLAKSRSQCEDLMEELGQLKENAALGSTDPFGRSSLHGAEASPTGSPLSQRGEQDRLRQALAESHIRIENLETDLRFMSEQRRVAERRLAKAEEDYGPLQKKNASLHGEVMALTSQLRTAESDVELYKKKFLQLTKGFKQNLEAEVAELKAQVSQLEEQIAKSSARATELQKTIDSMKTEAETLKTENERLVKELALAKTQLQSATAQVEQLQQQVAQHKTRLANADIQRKYQVQLSNMQSLVQQVNAEKEQLASDLSAQQALVATKQSKITQLEEDLHKQQEKQAEAAAAAAVTSQEVAPTPSLAPEQLGTVSSVVDEAVKVGILSSYLLRKLSISGPRPSSQGQPQTPPRRESAAGTSSDYNPLLADTAAVSTPPSEKIE